MLFDRIGPAVQLMRGRAGGEARGRVMALNPLHPRPNLARRQIICCSTELPPCLVGQISAGRRLRRPSPGSQVDAIDRPGGDLSGAENQRAASHAPDLSLSSQRDGYRPAQSGLVRRHHLYPRPAWLSVPGSDHGLGDAPRFILAAVEHHGRWILRRGLGRRAGPLRPAGDIQ